MNRWIVKAGNYSSRLLIGSGDDIGCPSPLCGELQCAAVFNLPKPVRCKATTS